MLEDMHRKDMVNSVAAKGERRFQISDHIHRRVDETVDTHALLRLLISAASYIEHIERPTAGPFQKVPYGMDTSHHSHKPAKEELFGLILYKSSQVSYSAINPEPHVLDAAYPHIARYNLQYVGLDCPVPADQCRFTANDLVAVIGDNPDSCR